MPVGDAEFERLVRTVERVEMALTAHIADVARQRETQREWVAKQLEDLNHSLGAKSDAIQKELQDWELWRAKVMGQAKLAGAGVGVASGGIFTLLAEWLKNHFR
jgi:hypothetical protein